MKNSILHLFINHIEQNSIILDKDGIIGDKHYKNDPERSILITSIKSYEISKVAGISLNYGDLGENILVDFDPYGLPYGKRLKIGDAIIEITTKSTLCKSLTKIDNKLPKLLKDDRGIYAKVVQGASVSRGDLIELV